MISLWYGPNFKKIRKIMKEMDQKHPSIKFDYKFQSNRIEVLDSLGYIDQKINNKIFFLRTLVVVEVFLMQYWNIRTHQKSISYSQSIQV